MGKAPIVVNQQETKVSRPETMQKKCLDPAVTYDVIPAYSNTSLSSTPPNVAVPIAPISQSKPFTCKGMQGLRNASIKFTWKC
jgi:hypothetical protein